VECNIHKLGAVQDVVDVLPKKFTGNEAVRVKFAAVVVNVHAVALVDANVRHAPAIADALNPVAQKDATNVDANVNKI
jgi:hypothetical protein